MLNLIDLIQLSDVDLGSFKIHCAVKSVATDPDDPFFGTTGDPDALQSQQFGMNEN